MDDLNRDGHCVGRSINPFGNEAGHNKKTERVKHV